MTDQPASAPEAASKHRTATLPETGALVAGHRWVEDALFTLTGGWSVDPSDPAVASFFASQSAIHAWRAGEWSTRLPRSVPAEPEAAVAAWSGALEQAGSAADPLQRLAIWAIALQPGLVARYSAHREVLAPTADAGLERWLDLALHDATGGWSSANGLLARRAEVVEVESDLRSALAAGAEVLGLVLAGD